ncbi:MAG: ABC transporter ATP-binding protein [Leptospiraceae bacterium]|nr:ABC transporter ATP-binding protein [Leptospiraceae bacterium]MCB1316866.1 ABC transporter ATP-binding protein [Leptospiraceae bacterium]
MTSAPSIRMIDQSTPERIKTYLSFLWKAGSKSRRWLYLAIISTGPILLLTIALPSAVERFLTALTNGARASAIQWTAIVLLCLVGRVGLEIANRYFLTELHAGSLQSIRSRCFEMIQRSSLKMHITTRSGELGNLLGFDSRLAAMGLLQLYQLTILYPPQIAGLLLLILYYDYRLALVAFLFFPVALFGTALISRRARVSERRFLEADAHMMGYAIESLNNVKQIQSMGVETDRRRQLEQLDARSMHWHKRAAVLASMPGPISELIIGTGMIGLILLVGSVNGPFTLDLSLMAVCVSALMMLRMPVRGFAAAYIESQGSFVSVQRLLWATAGASGRPQSQSEVITSERVHEIALSGITFAYDGRRHILKNLSAQFRGPGWYVIYGPSGAGKTTLLDILAGFYPPESGAIHINGNALSLHTLESWRARVGLVAQETLLFDDSIKNNICMGGTEATDDELRAVCAQAGLSELIARLPGGLDFTIGEFGRRLSGGERRRLSLARALIRSPEVLLLDEVTAELDSESEDHILQTLRKLADNYLLIQVSHREPVRLLADAVLEIRDGQLRRRQNHAD